MSKRVLYTYGVLALLGLGVAATEIFDLQKHLVKKDIFDCLDEFERYNDARFVECFDDIIKKESEKEESKRIDYTNLRDFLMEERGYKKL